MYQTIRPPHHLIKYIDHFWWGDDFDLSHSTNAYHSVASSKIELLFFDQGIYSFNNNGKKELVFRAGFYGQTTSFGHYFPDSKRTTIFGITFSPIAALKFFNIPAIELTHQKIELNVLLGNYADEFSERIFVAQTFKEKAKIATDFFSNRLKELHLKYLSIEKLILNIDPKNVNSIPNIVAQSFLSQRQFERNFKELTGFSAKTYLKLKRFEIFVEEISCLARNSEEKLFDIAMDLGYYDQSHLNRHFKEFTGMSPLEYLKKSTLLTQ